MVREFRSKFPECELKESSGKQCQIVDIDSYSEKTGAFKNCAKNARYAADGCNICHQCMRLYSDTLRQLQVFYNDCTNKLKKKTIKRCTVCKAAKRCVQTTSKSVCLLCSAVKFLEDLPGKTDKFLVILENLKNSQELAIAKANSK